MTTRAEDSAFPVVVPADNSEVHFGLSKREYFALHLLAAMNNSDADTAVLRADKLLAALND